jgi:hypothetical protein
MIEAVSYSGFAYSAASIFSMFPRGFSGALSSIGGILRSQSVVPGAYKKSSS